MSDKQEITDTQRIDWLDNQCATVSGMRGFAGNSFCVSLGTVGADWTKDYRTVREAIDAAMEMTAENQKDE